MNISHRNWPAGLGLIALMLVAHSFCTGRADAQQRSSQGSLSIKPYTGPPIYLDEPDQIAAPTIVRRETIPEKYEDGTVRIEREVAHFSDNHFEADGRYREYYPNGKLFVEGQFRRGRQHGEWTYFFDNGQLNRKATFNNGQPDGTGDVFRADGTLAGKRSFRDGQRHGEWITYDESGKQPLREEHYDDGRPDGVWKAWYPNGQQRQQYTFKKGVKHGTFTEWNDKGNKSAEVTYVDDKLDGTATQWLADGSKLVHEYDEGRLVSQKKQ